MSRHGHVTPNPDGSKARCGGPAICRECQREAGQVCCGDHSTGHRFLGEYDKDRVLRCIRCGMLPMQHYPSSPSAEAIAELDAAFDNISRESERRRPASPHPPASVAEGEGTP